VIVGYEKHELCHHLAKEDIPVTRLAELYGVTDQAIRDFRKRHIKKITAIREAFVAGLDTKLVGLWIANQEARIAAYQDDVDLIDQHLAESLDPDAGSDKFLRIKHGALKSVAEELGALPTRATVDHSGNVEVKYTVERPSDAE
jgi:hypothetical protein